ncbi:hypothetical protein PBI_DISMAS_62 [Microbacterium phage Dismas]|uniref:Uncharacterized protein n=1 Tax=Microbacterium phage Dismas TaxID=2065199 RepID=A0A2H5BFU3_9CAUD|nr:hypothetical protein FDJ24_gp62 [Microbacterium phage Dismas]AUG84859.1 hypothetical protein PBI_DISMAS_62 [Microbacterium phage Dismas]UYL86849.1 hypothetical protein SEA_RONA_61 [Microbacterium phage Rona]
MASLEGNPKPGYTVSLFVSKKVEPHSVKEGQYDTREFPGQTVELARVEYRGGELEALLEKAKQAVDLIEEV